MIEISPFWQSGGQDEFFAVNNSVMMISFRILGRAPCLDRHFLVNRQRF
jgi:hypothetical protein